MLQLKALDGDINQCFRLIEEWMTSYFLRLNASNTQFMIIIPPAMRRVIKIKGIFINGVCIRVVDCAKNLGVLLDNELTLKNKLVNS